MSQLFLNSLIKLVTGQPTLPRNPRMTSTATKNQDHSFGLLGQMTDKIQIKIPVNIYHIAKGGV